MQKRTKQYIETIKKYFSDLEISQTKPDFSGENSDVILINREIIFRFPKYITGIKSLSNEIAILRTLHSQLPIPIPIPLYVNLQSENPGEVFTGHKIIPGESLWREKFHKIKEPLIIKKIAKQLAEFIHELHAVPLETLPFLKEVNDKVSEVQQLYSDFKHYLYSHMRPDACSSVTRDFESFFENSEIHPFEPCLRHGDFGPSNILYDPAKKKISGVIDFGSTGIGDPAYDLASVSCFGNDFLNLFCEIYPASDNMLARARFFKSTFALMEALHGAKNNDPQAFENGIKTYR
ncbi:MAG: aminoglycoside phosphotransferase family protein [Anaerolineaceae bacterium]|nr:aminoglycoside phosphotransferase family protein [Anaerolineaceae bacterium]